MTYINGRQLTKFSEFMNLKNRPVISTHAIQVAKLIKADAADKAVRKLQQESMSGIPMNMSASYTPLY